MIPTEEELTELKRLVSSCVGIEEAERRLLNAIDTLASAEIALAAPTLIDIANLFQKKRKGRLLKAIAVRLDPEAREALMPDFVNARIPPEAQASLDRYLELSLIEIRETRMYDWAGLYREFTKSCFDELTRLVIPDASIHPIRNILTTRFAAHAKDIFEKGFMFSMNTLNMSQQQAITKQVNGLIRFLAVPIERYSQLVANADSFHVAKIARYATSAMLTGIVKGFSSVRFGSVSGASVASEEVQAWGHYIAFLCPEDAEQFIDFLAPSDVRDGLEVVATPVLRAIHQVLSQKELYNCLPRLGHYSKGMGRLEISIPAPSEARSRGFLEIWCFLVKNQIRQPLLEEAINRDVTIVAGQYQADTRVWAIGNDALRGTIVDVSGGATEDKQAAARRSATLLANALALMKGPVGASEPLAHNFAKEFPLSNPFIAQYFRVSRTSIRELMRASEGNTGIRLWCSPRRSGKTTAAFDLGASTGGAGVIAQTCDDTEQFKNASVFYRHWVEAAQKGAHLPDDFLRRTLAEASDGGPVDGAKQVLVLDEYETLFDYMKLLMEADPVIRYKVVQPLMNQMVGFSRDNLLIFVGQRPDAHYIIMDQNQLSPYVVQEPFPLFVHADGVGGIEFRELVRKVMTRRVGFDTMFLDCLYGETGGHPYLTVNCLIDLFEWLIEKRRPAKDLTLSADDYRAFADIRLKPEWLAVSDEYVFFRRAVAEALSERARRTSPWLFCVHGLLRVLSRCKAMSMSHEAAVAELKSIAKEAKLQMTEEECIKGAARANFLVFHGGRVSPRIPILARLCGASTES